MNIQILYLSACLCSVCNTHTTHVDTDTLHTDSHSVKTIHSVDELLSLCYTRLRFFSFVVHSVAMQDNTNTNIYIYRKSANHKDKLLILCGNVDVSRSAATHSHLPMYEFLFLLCVRARVRKTTNCSSILFNRNNRKREEKKQINRSSVSSHLPFPDRCIHK